MYYSLKIIGLIWVGVISTAISIITMIPYYLFKIGSLNNFSYLILSYFVIITGSVILSVLMTSGFYLIFRKVNITCIIMLLAGLFSFLAGTINYQYMWIQTGASGISENFGVSNNILGMWWNRLFGLTVTLSIFLFGMLCNRCYEKGLFKSFFKNCQKYKTVSICFLISFVGIFLVFKNEPIFKSVSPDELASMLIAGDKDTAINTNVKCTSNIVIDLKIEKRI